MPTPLFIFLLGLCIGSFLNVVIFRTRNGESLIRGASHCPKCKTILRCHELIPLVSFAMLRGRCRKCRERISIQYPLIEFATGVIFVVFFLWHAGNLTLFMRDSVSAIFLIAIAVYDIRYLEIPDRFTVPGMIFAFLANVWMGRDPLPLIIAGAIIGGFFFTQYAASKGRWVGTGDILLGVFMGLLLGLPFGLTALFVAYISGALFSVYLVLARHKTAKTLMPFGAFLSTSSLVVLVIGKPILDWYLGLLR